MRPLRNRDGMTRSPREEQEKLSPRRFDRRGPVDKLHFACPGIEASAVNASRYGPTVDGRQLQTVGCTSRIQRLAQRGLSLRVAPDDQVGVGVAVGQEFITEEPTFADRQQVESKVRVDRESVCARQQVAP